MVNFILVVSAFLLSFSVNAQASIFKNESYGISQCPQAARHDQIPGDWQFVRMTLKRFSVVCHYRHPTGASSNLYTDQDPYKEYFKDESTAYKTDGYGYMCGSADNDITFPASECKYKYKVIDSK